MKAESIRTRVLEVDLKTFLKATMELSQSHIVKKDVQNTLYDLSGYKMSA